ncbi:MAG: GAF domain-containing protein, partial [Okeania sp. SIO1H6]|nr:GAF domain-containing protein [Okeania sp. SIO1H6]
LAANICSSLIVPLFSRLDLIAVLALHQCGEYRNWQDHECLFPKLLTNYRQVRFKGKQILLLIPTV